MSLYPDTCTSSVEKLSDLFNSKIIDLFTGKGICSDVFFIQFCKQTEEVIGYFLNNEADLKSKQCLMFLGSTFPRVIDVLLRRTTKRQHVSVVMAVLRASVLLLSRRQLVEDDALHAKLMELRNHILSGGNTFRFVHLKELELMPGYNSYGLLGEHGKYESCIMNHTVVKFWPDDWKLHFAGQRAVNHFVSVFVDVCTLDSGATSRDGDGDDSVRIDTVEKDVAGALNASNTVEPDGVLVKDQQKWLWIDGQITSYDTESDLHTVTSCVRPLNSKTLPTNNDPGDESFFTKRTFQINLTSTLHTWIDGVFKDEVIAAQMAQGAGDSESVLSKHSDFLTFSVEDEGQYIQIDHIISGKKYFAKIYSFDIGSRTHNIVFDDKTSRELKFQERDREMNVTVIVNIPKKVIASTLNRSAGSSAKLVRSWFQSLSTSAVTVDGTDSEKSSAEKVAEGYQGAVLPEANSGSGACYLKVELIELFYREGGCNSILLDLSDESVSPPLLSVIILHMKLVYFLRNKLKQTIVEELVLKLKDFIPPCVLRFDEKHIKTLTKQDLNILIQGVKDIVFIVDPKNNTIRREMETLYLSIALKLLQSSQLQKRYFGLSIIREQVELVMPEILQPRYVLKKNFSNGPGGGDQRQAQAAAQARKHGPSVLGVKFIEKFILDSNIYDTVFGESLHQDLALKSDFLLVFLALRGSLNESHLQSIWQASCGGHEAVVRVLYQLILHIIPVLHPFLRMSLFRAIASTPQSLYSDQFLRMLKDFTLRSIQAFKTEKIDIVESSDVDKDPSATKSLLAAAMGHLGGEEGGTAGSDAKNVVKRSGSNGSESGDEGDSKLTYRLMKRGKRVWLGFSVLWRFVQDSSSSSGESDSSNIVGQPSAYVDEDLVDVAVQLIVDLLKEDAFKDEREYVLQRCVRNIQLGFSVPSSMKLIRHTLALYPSPGSGWFSNVKSSVKSTVTVTHMIDKLNKPDYGNLVVTIFAEMDIYHQTFKKQAGNTGTSDNSINGTRVKINGKRSKVSHFNCLVERLQLLVYILAFSPNVALNTKQVNILWKVYVEEAATAKIVDTFIEWISKLLIRENKQFDNTFLAGIVQNSSDKSISSPSKLQFLISSPGVDGSTTFEGDDEPSTSAAFSEGVLTALFESKIYPLTQLHADSPKFKLLLRPPMASFCMKLFLFVNQDTIRVDGDGAEGWYRSSGRMIGLDVLWKIATTATSTVVHEAASHLLVELHYRINPKSKDLDDIRGNFLKVCFSEMSRAIQCLQTGEVVSEGTGKSSEEPPEEESGVYDEKTLSRRVARYVNIMSAYIKRFDTVCRPYAIIHVVNSRNGLVSSSASGVDTFRSSTQFPITMTENIGSVRDRIASHFNVPVDVVGLSRVVGVKYGRVKSNGRNALLYCDNNECSYETLEKDNVTLQSMKFKPVETILVKRIEPADKTVLLPNDGQVVGGNHLFGKYKKEDIFEVQDLDSNFIPPLNPFAWLGMRTISNNAPRNSSFFTGASVFREPSFSTTLEIDESDGMVDFFALPLSPLPRHDDMCFSDAVRPNKTSIGSTGASDNSKISIILGQYLQKKPEHFSQMLQMLDGYFSVNRDVSEEAETDGREVSSVVWGVVQSLPCSQVLLSKIQKLIPLPSESRGSFTQGGVGVAQAAFFAELFDPSSPYSMLYSMQIVDAILSSTDGLLSMGRSQLEWGWKFIKLGGVEFLIRLFESSMQKWTAFLAGDDHALGKGRADVEALCLVMLMRLIHKFLLFDSTYSKWHLDPVIKTGALHAGETMNAFVPSGLLVSYLNVPEFFQKIIGTVFAIISAFNSRPFGGKALIAELEVSTVESLIDHSIVLIFGLVKSVDNCIDVLQSYSSIHRFLRAITVRPAERKLRQAGCRGLLQAATFVLARAAIPHNSTAKAAVSRRSSRNSSLVLQPIKGLKRPSIDRSPTHRQSVSPVSNADESDGKRHSFSTQSGRSSISSEAAGSHRRISYRDIGDCSELDNMQRQGLFHAIFNLVLQSIHPCFNTAEWDSVKGTESCLGPESYANGEDVYSLIAGLIALQSRPHILATAKLDFLSLPVHGPEPSPVASGHEVPPLSTESLSSWVDDDRLCGLFFEKLITHQSVETFHSNEQDETLTGVLRVLLVLVDSQPNQRKFVGAQRGHPNKLRQLARSAASMSQPLDVLSPTDDQDGEVNLIEFLYSQCLFPKQRDISSGGGKGACSLAAAACVSPMSRKLAYALLLELCADDISNFTALVDEMCCGSISIQEAAASGASFNDLLAGITDELGPKLFGVSTERESKGESRSSKTGKQVNKSQLQWEYDPTILVKKQNTYLGLVNQGCTCYMNAFLQQLFHVESFTEAFLAIESNVNNLSPDADDYARDNAVVLFELQVMFCYLKLSQKKFYDTIAFAKVFKDYDMEPIRLGEQKDNNEFASMLFDKLESNEECKSLIKDKFGGELVWQVISTDEECVYQSEREEPYFMLTAEVEGKGSLEDSLELYVTGETLSGDNKIEVEIESDVPGGECTKRKVDALRRCAIRTLPSVLIIHLKRFEFDAETMNRRKLNDLFTFPTELDMFPYTEEGLRQDEARKRAPTREEGDGPRDGIDGNEGELEPKVEPEPEPEIENMSGEKLPGYYRYTLKGVVVHAGAIDSGHYYSFVRVRSSRSSDSASRRNSPFADSTSIPGSKHGGSDSCDNNAWEWMEFNDTNVAPFSVDSIPSECFGGMVAGGVGPDDQRWKQHSAYMLIYERTHETESLPTQSNVAMDVGQMQKHEKVKGMDSDVLRARTESASLDCLLHLTDKAATVPSAVRQRTLPRALSASASLQHISPGVLSAVSAENSSFLMDLMRFNKDCILFHWKLLQVNVLSESLDVISRRRDEDEDVDAITQKCLVSRTIFLSLAFCFQVLFRARGQQCIPPFMEKMEDLIRRDESGFCAAGLLSEWTRETITQTGSPGAGAMHESVDSDSASKKSSSTRGRLKSHLPHNISSELLGIAEQLHPMLAVIFIDCPYTFTIDIFGRFLVSCINSLRCQVNHHQLYLGEVEASSWDQKKVMSKSGSVELGLDEDDGGEADTSSEEKEQDEALVNVSKFTSCVTRVVCKLLLLAESYQPVDIVHRRNYEVLMDTLRSFAMLGREEAAVLLKLGGVFRVVCSTVVLHPVHLRMPFRDCLRNAVDVACYLMQLAVFRRADSPSTEHQSPICLLTARDVQAFTSRMFLDISLNISHPDNIQSHSNYSLNFINALKNVCDQLPPNNVIKFFGFFLDKVFDNLAPNVPRTKLINEQIDLSFDVLCQLLVHLTESLVRVGKTIPADYAATRDRTEFILDQTLAWIISQTTRICQRKSVADADFVDRVMKLLFRIGFQSELGFKSVMKMKDQWQSFPKVYCRALDSKARPAQRSLSTQSSM